MGLEKGSLSIESENMFPIIKKWLYSDHDIFIREMISNGSDAITKRKKLDAMGEAELPEDYKPNIRVVVNTEEKTLSFIDNGIGMTFDEVKEYINQVAFSGATDFLEKYKDKDNADQIIGHFGLGFYSAFMVADSVTIDTLSYKEGAKAVHWESEGGVDFEMSDGNYDEVGTKITLYMSEDSLEFANEYRVKEVIEKYCSFMPIEIFMEKENAEQEYQTIDEEDLKDTDTVVEYITEPAKTEERENEDGTKETVEITPEKKKVKINKRPVSLSDTHPLWMKHPNECTDEEYKDFYRKVFNDYREPLFWIHLNMDYPFNLKGILYFPKVNTQYDNLEGVIKLYNSQVFIADNIKEVIPEFLMLLKGVIDCPDLPLNVSRSALQNDGFVKKISDYITKKVADKLSGMYKTKKEDYEKYWDDISPFIKYGCLRDDKFREKIKEFIIFKDLDGKYITLPEYIEADGKLVAGDAEEATDEKADETAENADETAENTETADEAKANTDEADASDDSADAAEDKPVTVYYVTDLQQQGQYIDMFKEQGLDALILTHTIDTPFIQQLEASEIEVGEDKKKVNVKFTRVDSQVTEEAVDADETDEEALKEQTEKLTETFKKALNKDNMTLELKSFKDESIASILTVSEESRRMQDMMKMYSMGGDMAGMGDMFGSSGTLVLNSNNKLVK
nr:molecular chaperone HtpG [Lachnospiraceae bacterium]